MRYSRRSILEEYARRTMVRNHVRSSFLRTPEFLHQNLVLNSRAHRFKSICCTRRAGKSTTEVIDHIEIAMLYPKSRTVYFGLTLDSVTDICWDIFKDLGEKHNLNLKFNETKKIVYYPNGSRTRLVGLDANERQIRKALGQKLRKVSIDEAGSVTANMEQICYQMIMPALSDLRPLSWLTMLGTPENIPNTFFEKVDKRKEKGAPWEVFRWTAYDNPFMKPQWTDEISELKANNPKVVEASWFRTHYLNEWCTDDDLLIYSVTSMILTTLVFFFFVIIFPD